MVDLTLLVDATAERKVLGLLETAPGFRPADALTCVVSVSFVLIFLDIGAAAPHAFTLVKRAERFGEFFKMLNYRDHLEDLRFKEVIYTHFVWSCWGRERENTTKVLR